MKPSYSKFLSNMLHPTPSGDCKINYDEILKSRNEIIKHCANQNGFGMTYFLLTLSHQTIYSKLIQNYNNI